MNKPQVTYEGRLYIHRNGEWYESQSGQPAHSSVMHVLDAKARQAQFRADMEIDTTPNLVQAGKAALVQQEYVRALYIAEEAIRRSADDLEVRGEALELFRAVGEASRRRRLKKAS